MKRKRLKNLVCACVLVYMYFFFGVGDYLFAKSFDKYFDYPLNVDIRSIVDDLTAGKKINVTPINYYPYRFLTNSGKCSTIEKLDLFIAVKSALPNLDRRKAIRQTYAQENIPGRIVKTLFFLGIDSKPKSELQKQIDQEMAEYKDIIQIDFHDAYFNNTIKTMMTFRWIYEQCNTADFYFFTDDDMYVSVKNLLEYLHDKTVPYKSNAVNKNEEDEFMPQTTELKREDFLYAGYVFNSAPKRFRFSKYTVDLYEYKWDRWPSYVTAGAYVLSNKTLKLMYVASLFVKHFRFDDIYLGIVAEKVGVPRTHCSEIYFYKKTYNKDSYRKVIASHGYTDPNELIRVWNEQNNVSKAYLLR